MAGGRKKKRRVAPAQDEEAARRTFLEALASQRANARSQEDKATTAAPTPAAPLAGFYYDEAKGRYFRSSPASEHQQREQLQLQEQKVQIVLQKEANKTKFHRGYGRHCHNWVAYMAQRQSDYGWSARGRDHREMIPQWLSGVLPSQILEVQKDVMNDGRLTALALHPLSTNLGAIGASGGRLDILGMERFPLFPGSKSSSQRVVPMTDVTTGGIITALQWRPVRELDLLFCHLGRGNGNSQTAAGSVCILRAGEQDGHGGVSFSNSLVKEMHFIDPWTAKWNPADVSKFSLGCGGPATAVYMNERGQMQLAPKGVIADAVHTQDFYSTGQVLLNGTKSGGLWGWDLRVKRRIYEWKAEATAEQPGGTVVDIHILNDCSKAVVQRSSGELRLIDLRMNKPVIEFMPGAPHRYLPHLRCDVDQNESVVVAGGDMQHPQAVNSYDLRTGRCVASLEVEASTKVRPTLVQQVKLKLGEGRHRHIPEIWALSRNELYACNGLIDHHTM